MSPGVSRSSAHARAAANGPAVQVTFAFSVDWRPDEFNVGYVDSSGQRQDDDLSEEINLDSWSAASPAFSYTIRARESPVSGLLCSAQALPALRVDELVPVRMTAGVSGAFGRRVSLDPAAPDSTLLGRAVLHRLCSMPGSPQVSFQRSFAFRVVAESDHWQRTGRPLRCPTVRHQNRTRPWDGPVSDLVNSVTVQASTDSSCNPSRGQAAYSGFSAQAVTVTVGLPAPAASSGVISQSAQQSGLGSIASGASSSAAGSSPSAAASSSTAPSASAAASASSASSSTDPAAATPVVRSAVNTAAIAGGTAAAVVALIALGVGLFFLMRKRRRARQGPTAPAFFVDRADDDDAVEPTSQVPSAPIVPWTYGQDSGQASPFTHV